MGKVVTNPIGLDVGKGVPVQNTADVKVFRCPDCKKQMSRKSVQESLWGRCKECENDRLGAV